MIVSFADKNTQEIFSRGNNKRFAAIAKQAARRLRILNVARTENDLKNPPGNRFEWLKGERKGWCSIRVNDQWRIVFRWTENGAEEVSIEDYH